MRFGDVILGHGQVMRYNFTQFYFFFAHSVYKLNSRFLSFWWCFSSVYGKSPLSARYFLPRALDVGEESGPEEKKTNRCSVSYGAYISLAKPVAIYFTCFLSV